MKVRKVYYKRYNNYYKKEFKTLLNNKIAKEKNKKRHQNKVNALNKKLKRILNAF